MATAKKRRPQMRLMGDYDISRLIEKCEDIDKAYPDGPLKDKNRAQINELKERLKKGK